MGPTTIHPIDASFIEHAMVAGLTALVIDVATDRSHFTNRNLSIKGGGVRSIEGGTYYRLTIELRGECIDLSQLRILHRTPIKNRLGITRTCNDLVTGENHIGVVITAYASDKDLVEDACLGNLING